jgi:hypothetical protein
MDIYLKVVYLRTKFITMKKFFQFTTLLIAAFIIHSSVSAQENTGVTFSMIKKDGKLMTRNSLEQKVLDFYVIGLNTNQEVDAFIAKFKAVEGVVDITISYDLADNKRLASATFQGASDKAFLKKVLIDTGVTQVTVDGKTMNTSDIQTEKNTEKNSDTDNAK